MSTTNYDWKKELEEQERREQHARETSLHKAFDDIEEFKRRLAAGADVEERNKMGMTPLYALFWHSNLTMREKFEFADLLTELGADVNVQEPEVNLSLLYRAVYEREPVVVGYLLSKGADPTIQNKYGDNPLDLARKKGYWEIVELLEAAMPEQDQRGVVEKQNDCEVKKPSFWDRTYSINHMFWMAVGIFTLGAVITLLIVLALVNS